MRKRYNVKAVWSGSVVELYEYENSIVKGETNNGFGRSTEANEENKARHRKNTLARARRTVRRLINAKM